MKSNLGSAVALWVSGISVVLMMASCARLEDTKERDRALISFGEQLFHDASLSADGQLRCASCHTPTRHFTDATATAVGFKGAVGTRNAPSLMDIRLVSEFFWDGRESRLEEAVLQPFTNTVEMGLPNHSLLLRRIHENPRYRKAIHRTFGTDNLTANDVAQALAAYLRALPVNQTRYDIYVVSHRKKGLSTEEVQGLQLFEGKAECSECHKLHGSPAYLTDNKFHHTGVGFDKIAGNIAGIIPRLDRAQEQGLPLGQIILSDINAAELGRFAHTRRASDLGAFRTPTLRNVAMTAPYMHDGSISTLEDAIAREIYYRSLARGRPISLTVEEQRQLHAFLLALNTVPNSRLPSVPAEPH